MHIVEDWDDSKFKLNFSLWIWGFSLPHKGLFETLITCPGIYNSLNLNILQGFVSIWNHCNCLISVTIDRFERYLWWLVRERKLRWSMTKLSPIVFLSSTKSFCRRNRKKRKKKEKDCVVCHFRKPQGKKGNTLLWSHNRKRTKRKEKKREGIPHRHIELRVLQAARLVWFRFWILVVYYDVFMEIYILLNMGGTKFSISKPLLI